MEIQDSVIGIKTFQVVDPSVSDDFESQVVDHLYKIQLSLPSGTNYLYARDFEGDHGRDEALDLIEQIKEKGKVNIRFWQEGPQQRKPEIMAQKDQEEQSFGPRH